MNKSYKYRIFPNSLQQFLIEKTFNACIFVYNHYLEIQLALFNKGEKRISAYDCIKNLTELKKEEEWLNEVSSQALQCSLQDVNSAFCNYLNDPTNAPKFKSETDDRKSYTTKGSIHYLGEHIQIPTLGLVKTQNCLVPEGRILNVTVSKEPSGKYYVTLFCTDVEVKAASITEKIVGLTLGIENICATSDGNVYKNPNNLKQSFDKLAKLQRELSRKEKGSANYEKARIKVAKAQERIKNQRNDYLQKLTTDLINNYDVLYIEDPEIRNTKNKIVNVSFHNFINMLRYKAEYYGKKIIFVKADVQFDANTYDVEYLRNKAEDILQAGLEQCSGEGGLAKVA